MTENIRPVRAVAVRLSEVGSTHMDPAEDYYTAAQLEQARREEREACLKAADEALCAIRARNEKGGA